MFEFKLDLLVFILDEVKEMICYMCVCWCGICVYIKDGFICYIEGNIKYFVNEGVFCVKGVVGIM